MTSNEIREKFLKFFKERGHAIVPSSSLVPEDPSVLLTTAGMQQFKRYFTGELDPVKDFGSKNTTSIQKSFRTSDIDEVGDESHLTFFEMLGNFSFGYRPGEPRSPKGGYFKEEAIKMAYEFITSKDWMGLEIDYVSVFEGDDAVPADTESEEIWKSLGVTNIKKFGREDNFWGPTGSEGPCGPTTEIYVKGVEVWNIVFNEFYCGPNPGVDPVRGPRQGRGSRLRRLASNGVDTGMGLERLAMVSQKVPTIFETDLFSSLVDILPKGIEMRTKRIIADHIRSIIFLVSDGVRPSNKEAGHVLRTLMRRVMVHIFLYHRASEKENVELAPNDLFKEISDRYKYFYPEIDAEAAMNTYIEESDTFRKTLEKGLKELSKADVVDAKFAFDLFQSYGLYFEIIKDIGGEKAKKLEREDFEKELDKHREVSRAGLEKKFGGHGLILDTGELKAADEEEFQKVLRLHTATHILQSALRKVLGESVGQRGSDVNAKRTRFDFNFDRKLTDKEKERVEEYMNEVVERDLPVNYVELSKEEAEKTGALYFFKEKYPEVVKIYYIGESLETAVSKEFCGGPHVEHTGQIGKIRIKKQESIGAGVRRIKAIVE